MSVLLAANLLWAINCDERFASPALISINLRTQMLISPVVCFQFWAVAIDAHVRHWGAD